MILELILAAAQAAAAPAATPPMSAGQRRGVEALAVWMRCVAPPIQNRSFATAAEADAAIDASLARCERDEKRVRDAFATGGLGRSRARTLVADFRQQFRTQVHARNVRPAAAAAPALTARPNRPPRVRTACASFSISKPRRSARPPIRSRSAGCSRTGGRRTG